MTDVIDDARAMKQLSSDWRAAGLTIGFIPTMGALHEGHLSLVRRARRDNDKVVVSIFVNPLQFGPGEDFERYPRDLPRDCTLLEEAGCDAVFAASAERMYPEGYSTHVVSDELANRFEGAVRPQHFRGVLTVVVKLFNIVHPDLAYFGQKDAQQAVLVRRMARDLNFALDIEVLPIVRDEHGLALSSRNAYLSPAAKQTALALPRALQAAEKSFEKGERHADALVAEARSVLDAADGIDVDYVALVDPRSFDELETVSDAGLLLLAVRVEKTRLIDNVLLGGGSL